MLATGGGPGGLNLVKLVWISLNDVLSLVKRRAAGKADGHPRGDRSATSCPALNTGRSGNSSINCCFKLRGIHRRCGLLTRMVIGSYCLKLWEVVRQRCFELWDYHLLKRLA